MTGRLPARYGPVAFALAAPRYLDTPITSRSCHTTCNGLPDLLTTQAFSEPRSGTETRQQLGRLENDAKPVSKRLDALGFKPKRLSSQQTSSLTTPASKNPAIEARILTLIKATPVPLPSGMSNGRRVVSSAISALGDTSRPPGMRVPEVQMTGCFDDSRHMTSAASVHGNEWQ